MNQQGRLAIPKPCHENWLSMSEQEQGRHCGVCCKTVMDFTAMPTEKVIEIISQKKEGSICGRFRPDQLQNNPAAAPRKRYRVFMAALYLVFGGLLFTSCRTNEPKMGKVKADFNQTENGFNNLDTPTSTLPHVMGKPACTTPVLPDTLRPEMLGEVMYIPEDTTQH